MSNKSGRHPIPKPTLLVVEGATLVGANLHALLSPEGFNIVMARTEVGALAAVACHDPSVVLIDMECAEASGIQVCKAIRAESHVPVVVVSTHNCENDAIASFDAGADDYVGGKPHRWRELVARIRALIRRSPVPLDIDERQLLCVAGVELDALRHEVRVDGRPLALPLREFEVLQALMENAGRVWTREALMRRVWGETPASGTKSLDVHVKRIRARIEDDAGNPRRIVTVRGVGYKFAYL